MSIEEAAKQFREAQARTNEAYNAFQSLVPGDKIPAGGMNEEQDAACAQFGKAMIEQRIAFRKLEDALEQSR
jgi:hypothetical protein